jgi:hypothetical protein
METQKLTGVTEGGIDRMIGYHWIGCRFDNASDVLRDVICMEFSGLPIQLQFFYAISHNRPTYDDLLYSTL